ncbi:hypothetical protein P0F65_23025 [Sphingomonas sp. I4]
MQIVLKFVKQGSPDRPVARFQPESCPACAPVTTPLFNADNPRETVVALRVPRRRSLELAFDGPRQTVRRVILSGGDVPFRSGPHGVVVQLPPVATDAITAAEVATHIVELGMVLRFEHADPARRAGAYATGPFPDRQRRAANVLEFAQREVVRRLGLGEEAEREGWAASRSWVSTPMPRMAMSMRRRMSICICAGPMIRVRRSAIIISGRMAC